MTPTTIVCGPPGAGKSTYVKGRKGPNDLVIDVDELFKAMTLLDARQKPERLVAFVLEARDAVLGLLKRGFPGPDHAWVIMCGKDNEARAELARSLRAVTVVVAPLAGECKRRMVEQGRPRWHIEEMTSVAERWHARFRAMPGEQIEYAKCGREIGLDGWPLDAA